MRFLLDAGCWHPGCTAGSVRCRLLVLVALCCFTLETGENLSREAQYAMFDAADTAGCLQLACQCSIPAVHMLHLLRTKAAISALRMRGRQWVAGQFTKPRFKLVMIRSLAACNECGLDKKSGLWAICFLKATLHETYI